MQPTEKWREGTGWLRRSHWSETRSRYLNHPACNKNEWVLTKSCLTVLNEIYECVTKQKFEIRFPINIRNWTELKMFFRIFEAVHLPEKNIEPCRDIIPVSSSGKIFFAFCYCDLCFHRVCCVSTNRKYKIPIKNTSIQLSLCLSHLENFDSNIRWYGSFRQY